MRHETPTGKLSPEYIAYMASPTWKLKRWNALTRAFQRCQRCSARLSDTVLEVHHLSYERFGQELPDDLMVLCKPCHEKAHVAKRQSHAASSAARLWGARVDGWAGKKYGEDWDQYGDPDVIEREFEIWADRQE